MTSTEGDHMTTQDQFAEIIFPDGSSVKAYAVPSTEVEFVFTLKESDSMKAAGDFVRAAGPEGRPTPREAVTLKILRGALAQKK